MGQHQIDQGVDNESLRSFMRALLEDVHALEAMLERGIFESGVRRIGAEQEMFLVDRSLQPVNRALRILERLGPGPFTTELGLFNLEANLSPLELIGDALSRMEAELQELLGRIREAAAEEGVRVVLCGILPTLDKGHLGLESMTPNPRFFTLNRVMRQLRGGEFRTLIKGLDELQTTHDNVMLEACNTSFQLHFQVAPAEFAKLYNVAQMVTAPVLAVGVNSPVVLRHRLWHETRVALFQQSLDTRSHAHTLRGGRMRVSFGDKWIDNSIMEIFREDVARFRVLIATELEESPLEVLKRGQVPSLKALRLHNGTIYRWNRPCYGLSEGRPHLRIENRVLPAGPSVIDEVANAAFYYGLMCAISEEYADVRRVMAFDDAKDNFINAARYGLHARLKWVGGRAYGAEELILGELVPRAQEGLVKRGVDRADVERYLDVIRQRASTGRTGAQWVLDSLEAMDADSRPVERYSSLTAAMLARQATDQPVHEWPLAELQHADDKRESFRTVGQIMATDLFTVHPEDLVDLAASVMDWEHLRHVPVEDHEGRLIGLVTHRQLLRMIGQGARTNGKALAVREIMRPNPLTVGPDTSTVDAMTLMREHKVSCLPVVKEGKLVGIVTESDFMDVAAQLLDQWLRAE